MAAVVWLLAVCCGAILSTSDAWQSRKEFEFSVSGRNALSLPSVSKMVTGIHYKGRLLIQTHDAKTLVMKMVNMSYTNFNLELPEGPWQKLPFSVDDSISLSLSDKVFIVRLYSSGLIKNMTVSSTLSENDVNFLQGIASQLQFDLMGNQATQTNATNDIHGRRKYYQPADFSVTEDSVAGRCVVRYDVTPLAMGQSSSPSQSRLCGNRPLVEVLKSRDYDKCTEEAEYHAGLPGVPACAASGVQCAPVWSRAALTRVLGCGTHPDFVMLSSVASAKVVANLHLHNSSEAVMDSFVRLDLLDSRELGSQRFSPPNNTKTFKKLQYLYPTDQQANPDAPIGMSTLHDELQSHLVNSFTRNVREAEEEVQNKHKSKQTHRKLDFNKKKKSKKVPLTTASPPVTTTSEKTNHDKVNPWTNVEQHDLTNYPDRPFSALFLAHREADDRVYMVQHLNNLVSEIADELETPQLMPEKRTMEKMNLVVDICRTMTHHDLQKVMEPAIDAKGRGTNIQTQRKIFRDAVKMCGTEPAFKLVKSWIETKKIIGQEACDVVATLPRTLLTPNIFVVHRFFELVTSSAVNDDEQLQITSALAFNNLLRVACVKVAERRARFPAMSPGTECTPENAIKYVHWFNREVKRNPALRQAYLFALGNSASIAALAGLKAAAVNTTYTPGDRATAVLAMKELLIRNANATVPTLLHLYQDSTQPLPVRLAAAALLVFARSSPVVWQRLALSTWFERSPAVCAFVWSSLSTLAQTRDPVLKPIAKNAARVLLLAKPMRLGIHLPFNAVWNSVTSELRQVILTHFAYSPIRDASHLYYRYIQRMDEFSKGAFESEVWVSSPDDFLSLMSDFLHPNEDSSKVRPTRDGILFSTRWLHEKLQIVPRNIPPVRGRLRFRYDGLQEQLFLFNRSVFTGLAKEGQALVNEMQTGKSFHLQNMNMAEIVLSTTTEMGFPLSFQVRRFWAGRTVGQATANIADSSAKFNVSGMFSQQLMSELSFFVGWDKKQHVVASHALTVGQLPPLQVEAALRANTTRLALDTQMFVPPTGPVPLIRHSSVPFTAEVDTLNLTPKSSSRNTRLLLGADQSGDQMLLGPLTLTYKSDGALNTLRSWLSNVHSVFGQLMMWPTLHHGDLRVTLIPLPPVKVNVSFGDAETRGGIFHLKNFPKPLLNNTLNKTLSVHNDTQLEYSSPDSTLRTTDATQEKTSSVVTETSTEETTTTTEQSNSTTEQSTSTTEQSTTTTDQSTTTTDQSTTTTDQSTTTTDQSTTTTEQSTTTTDQSTTTTEQSTTTTEQSTTTTEQSTTTTEQSTTTTEPWTTTTEQSTITTEQSTTSTEQSTTTTDQSTTTTEQSTTTTDQSTTTTDQSTTTTEQSTTTTEQSTTSTEQSNSTTETSVETTTDIHSTTPLPYPYNPLACTTESQDTFPVTEDGFNATVLDPFSDDLNGSRVVCLLEKVLFDIPDGRSFAVEVNASIQTPSPIELSAILTLGESKNGSTFRKGLFLKSEPYPLQTFLTANLNVPSVPLVDALKLLETNLSTTLTADLVVNIKDNRFVLFLESNAVRSDKRTNYLKQSDDFKYCSKADGTSRHLTAACRSLAEAASTLSRYDTTVSYKNVFLESLWGSSPPGNSSTRMVLELSDEDNALDVWWRTPKSDEENMHTVVNPLVISALRLNPTCSIRDGFGFSAYCGVGAGHVRTYDGLEFEYALDSNWHLLTKDCSGKTRVAVLARSANNITELYVNVDNFVVLHVSDVDVSVNGDAVTTPASFTDLAGTTLMNVVKGTDKALQVSLPQHGLKVLYADSAVLLYSDLGTTGRLCGICGDNDGSTVGELKNPLGEVELTSSVFAASYKLPNTTAVFKVPVRSSNKNTRLVYAPL